MCTRLASLQVAGVALAAAASPATYFSVTKYGAVGDGNADCTAAVEATIAAAAAGGEGAVIHFPAGDFVV